MNNEPPARMTCTVSNIEMGNKESYCSGLKIYFFWLITYMLFQDGFRPTSESICRAPRCNSDCGGGTRHNGDNISQACNPRYICQTTLCRLYRGRHGINYNTFKKTTQVACKLKITVAAKPQSIS